MIVPVLFTCLSCQAEKAIEEAERKCDQRIGECKEESKQHLVQIQDEHAAQVCSETSTHLCLNDLITTS